MIITLVQNQAWDRLQSWMEAVGWNINSNSCSIINQTAESPGYFPAASNEADSQLFTVYDPHWNNPCCLNRPSTFHVANTIFQWFSLQHWNHNKRVDISAQLQQENMFKQWLPFLLWIQALKCSDILLRLSSICLLYTNECWNISGENITYRKGNSCWLS